MLSIFVSNFHLYRLTLNLPRSSCMVEGACRCGSLTFKLEIEIESITFLSKSLNLKSNFEKKIGPVCQSTDSGYFKQSLVWAKINRYQFGLSFSVYESCRALHRMHGKPVWRFSAFLWLLCGISVTVKWT